MARRNIPDEVIVVILSKLSFKNLLQLKSVSKSWNSIIHGPQLCIRRYRSHPQNSFLVWDMAYTECLPLMRLLENGDFKDELLVFPVTQPVLPLYSANGILLLKTRQSLWLTNGTMRSYQKIRRLGPSERPINYGHFYDSRLLDYKVVIVYRPDVGREEYSVYSCRNRRWSLLKPFLQRAKDLIEHRRGVFVDGCFYWWLRDLRRLMGFDVRNGVSDYTDGPDELRELLLGHDGTDDVVTINLTELTGRLCLHIKKREWMDLRVWVMEKNDDDDDERCFGSWRELMRFEEGDDDVREISPEDSVVCFVDQILPRSRFYVYNHAEKRYGQSNCTLNPVWYHNLIQCSDSLFCPEHYYHTVRIRNRRQA